jgi:hypothetical protein
MTGAGGSGGEKGVPGNSGNAGNPGSSATQSSVNCVTVTSGGSYPITVGTGSPAGQVVISWNAQ